MAVLNPGHLLDQAEKLIERRPAGPPRQVDLRRAISAAYYAVFHYVLTLAADDVVGVTKRNTPRYTLVYRSVDHRSLRDLCLEAKRQTMAAKYRKYVPVSGLGEDIKVFAGVVLELQEKRHAADYDPAYRVKTSDATLAIAAARSAIRRFERADEDSQRAFLALLLFLAR